MGFARGYGAIGYGDSESSNSDGMEDDDGGPDVNLVNSMNVQAQNIAGRNVPENIQNVGLNR